MRVTRGLVKLLQERTSDGYVFRVDLRLRPDPASTQVAVSVPSALNYYESVGRNWERAAMIKARACAGDLATGEALLNELGPFIWRKHLDFAAIVEVQAMKEQIHSYKGHGEIAIEGHNLKLGRGGIREIEFFVQTQQLIAGGGHPRLRGRSTLAMLAMLAEGGWISPEACDDMAAAYDFLRKAEHRLQMVADEQTQTLPADREGVERFARFLGFADRDAFAALLGEHLGKVQRHYEQLFEAAPGAAAEERGFLFPNDRDDPATLDNLSSLGFRNPLQVSERVRLWFSGGYRALRGEAARQHLAVLLPSLLRHLSKTENPETVVAAFDDFLSELNAGERLLRSPAANPDLVGFIVLILGTAPRLSDILARYPHVIDPLLEPGFDVFYELQTYFSYFASDVFFDNHSFGGSAEVYLTRFLKTGASFQTGRLKYYSFFDLALQRSDRLRLQRYYLAVPFFGNTAIGFSYNIYRLTSDKLAFDQSYKFWGGFINYEF